jgi:hypothetical protein
MEPFDTGPKGELGIAGNLLEDIGWGPVATDLTDSDGDAIPAACDPCPADGTNLCFGACARIAGSWTSPPATFPSVPNQNSAVSTIVIKGLNQAPDRRDILAKGFFNPATETPEINPKANGLRARLENAGNILLEVDIPGDVLAGADYSIRSRLCGHRRDGWTEVVRQDGRKIWRYQNKSGVVPPTCAPDSARGIRSIVIKYLPNRQAYWYVLRTKDRALDAPLESPPISSMTFELVLGAGPDSATPSQQAIDGQCAAAVLDDPPEGPRRPFCRRSPANRLVCRGL